MWNYGNSLSHFFDKNFVKVTVSLNKEFTKELIWRKNIFWWEWISRFSTLCAAAYLDCFHGALTCVGRKKGEFPDVADLKGSVESNLRGAPKIRPPRPPSLPWLLFCWGCWPSASRKSACSTTPAITRPLSFKLENAFAQCGRLRFFLLLGFYVKSTLVFRLKICWNWFHVKSEWKKILKFPHCAMCTTFYEYKITPVLKFL